jgi:hypothetical protein
MIASIWFELIALVVGVGVFEGGRYERQGALLLAVQLILFELTMTAPVEDGQTLAMVDVVELGFVPVFVWLALRHRAPWLVALAAVESVTGLLWVLITLDNGLHELVHRLIFFGLEGAKAACLGWGVWARLLSSPRQPPDALSDIDLYAAAAARWPGRVAG